LLAAFRCEEQVVDREEDQVIARLPCHCDERPDHTHKRTHKMNAAPCTLSRTIAERATDKPLRKKRLWNDGGTMRTTIQRTPSPP
jgi:hypothetical protein